MERVEPPFIEVGDVVQIDPQSDDMFGACFMIVSEVKTWGAQGYIQVPGKGEEGGRAYYRCNFENMMFVGKSIWVWEYKGKEEQTETMTIGDNLYHMGKDGQIIPIEEPT